MTEERCTPGPWNGLSVRIGGDASIVGNERLIASVHPKSMRASDPEGDAERDANARLIAASPDMFDVLEHLVNGTADIDTIYEDARAAIAKARGQ